MAELEDDNIVKNTPESWYFSKRLLYGKLNEIKENSTLIIS